MFDRRALPGTLAGFAALILAVAAVATRQSVLVVLAGILTAVCVILVLTLPSRAPVRYKERKTLRDEAAKLSEENDRMAARAAKFEAEAIAAKEKLATAMLADNDPGPPPADEAAVPPSALDITDPETGETVFLKAGRFGNYVQIGEIEKAIRLVKLGLTAGPGVTWAYRDLASFCANADRREEADEAVAALMRSYPGLTVKRVIDSMPPATHSRHQGFLEGLRRAGVPDG